MKNIIFNIIQNFPPETAHSITLKLLKLSFKQKKIFQDPILHQHLLGLDFFNPVGMAAGFDNSCEDQDGETHWYVLHAEANAILKTAASNRNCRGATLYLTISPCKDCSKLIHQSGINRLVFIDEYKDIDGVNFLETAGVEICKISKSELDVE